MRCSLAFFSIRFDVIPSHLIMPHLRHLYFLAHLVALIRRCCHMIYVRGTLTRTQKSTSGPNINSLELLCAYFYGFFILFFWLIYFSSFSRKINLNATAARLSIQSRWICARRFYSNARCVCIYWMCCVSNKTVGLCQLGRLHVSPFRPFDGFCFSAILLLLFCVNRWVVVQLTTQKRVGKKKFPICWLRDKQKKKLTVPVAEILA